MLFRQRKQPNLWGRIRLCLWPRRSFSRSLRYLGKRLLRIPASPHIIALGLAIGIFFAATPLYGFHILFAVFFAWILSANIAAAALGTVLANPLTIPFIFSATYETGRLILPIKHKSIAMPALWEQLQDLHFSGLAPVLLQISAGAVFCGLILAFAAYFAAFRMTKRFQTERKKRLAAPRGRRAGFKRGGALCAAFAAPSACLPIKAGKAAGASERAGRDCLL